MGEFEQFEKDGQFDWGEGEYITVSEQTSGMRRGYISSEAFDFLGRPRYVSWLIDAEDDRLAIEPTTESDSDAYRVYAESGHVAMEGPLQQIDPDEDPEGRVYLTRDPESTRLIAHL